MRFFILISLFSLVACVTPPEGKAPPRVTLTPVSFQDLPGWEQDSLEEAQTTFRRSCEKIKNLPPDRAMGGDPQMGTASRWQQACEVLNRQTFAPVPTKTYFEENFQPYAVGNNGDTQGLFTGYYEAQLNGSRTRHGPYTTPLLTRPADLVMVNLGDFREELKGQRTAGRVVGGQLKPYDDRAAITQGSLAGHGLEMVWVDDPVEAFFLHVQGSGRITLDDGQEMRVGYAAQNGHPYKALRRILVEKGLMSDNDANMPGIRQWLSNNPDQAMPMLNSNPSYVFFRELKEEGPIGAQNLPLTPGRSLAIDPVFIPYGAPLWLDTVDPLDINRPLRRLMVAQDTGGAIKGPVRGDFFWGHGEDAELRAGLMKSPGRYFILIPKEGY